MEQENQSGLFNELEFDHVAKQHIKGIAQWGMIAVVLAVVGYIINLIQAFTANPYEQLAAQEGFGNLFQRFSGTSKGSTIFFVVVGLFLNFFLFRFCTQARRAADLSDSTALGSSFSSLKGYFMIQAILVIIVFLIFLLAILVGGFAST